MSVWGKIIGGAVGFFAMGGPLGALLGVAAGHLIDQTVKSRGDPAGEGRAARPDREELQVAFTIAVIALAAKLAKADGRVTRNEVAALRRVFPIPDEAKDHAGRIFDEAKKSPEGFEPYARQIATLLRGRPAVLEDLLGALLMIAHSDGSYHPSERAAIAEIGRIFGFGPADVRRIENTFVAGGATTGADPYEVLGLSGSATDAEVRRVYRKLLRENHPDRAIAQGLPKEFVEVANKKMAEINAAYDRIKAERGLS